ncbi:MAG: bifunctional riboflavin kinase/FAD synthetase [Planctomycetota bacterium]|nr:MAG: bifunctional riboflavin kinase/FAD synthetase [Planctomycetota bacterium]
MATVIRSLDALPSTMRGGAVSVGNFDGVHRGHAALAAELVRLAREVGGPAVVMTFDPPPVAILVPNRPPTPPLTTISRRAELLGGLGVDGLIAYPTDRTLLELTPEAFFQRILVQRLQIRAIVEGPNFRFGRDRAGDTALLAELCKQAKIRLSIVPPAVDEQGEMISSTRIRRLIAAGNIEEANRLLTQPYCIEGIVSKGAERGKRLGFPTANLEGIRCLMPAHGVYGGAVPLGDAWFPAAVHIGPNPTFDEQRSKVEVHVLDWEGDLYGHHLRCALLHRVREICKFDSIEALRAQLRQDIESVREGTRAGLQRLASIPAERL